METRFDNSFSSRRWKSWEGKQVDRWRDLNGLIDELPGSWSKRYVYYLVQTKQIPHYKPSKKKLLFNLDEVEQWLKGTRVDPDLS